MTHDAETTAASVPPTAVVTGAGSGIGRSTAQALLTAGWRVAVSGRRENALKETVAAAPDEAVLVFPADVTVPESVAALFGAVADRWGRLDLLVNNAGVSTPGGAVDKITLAEWQQVVDVNLTGAFLCAHHAVRMMKAQDPQGGRIINNGSISAHTPRPASVAYTATKHAMTGLTKSISLDGRRFDIACGQIDVGNAATEITQKISDGVRQADGSKRAEPTFDPRHVADAVLYMASLPLDTNVQFLTITATKMPFIGRG
ncbi:MAG TPA: SDR family oxidoreductase [Streptosporangiaceae bacterium]|jgi:NAD(P)-dependent dehydrogenase (short-subunit alcohol dehydrogenase family)|nr:SDR family oxidoreductase [Streptosporangiaceae bacterium]